MRECNCNLEVSFYLQNDWCLFPYFTISSLSFISCRLNPFDVLNSLNSKIAGRFNGSVRF